jgi:hypothetical protein|tara:strand:- start:379 stop:549 length:171 start_codon:yes stop_codon:yes gene_type:complete
MSLTKRYIDEMMMMGVDVLHPDYQHSDDEYEYEKWCHYSGLPSPSAYEKKEKKDEQ